MRKSFWLCLMVVWITLLGCSAETRREAGGDGEHVDRAAQAFTASTTVTFNNGNVSCTVCGGTYSYNGSSGWNGGDFPFTDPSPAGQVVTTIAITFNYGGCLAVPVTVSVNGTTIGMFTTAAGVCACNDACAPPVTLTLTDPTGIPGYVNGGTNTMHIAVAASSFTPHNAIIQVSGGTTSTSLMSTSNPSVFGQGVTFTATVAPIPGSASTPVGNVTSSTA
jgi:hypothetical protein